MSPYVYIGISIGIAMVLFAFAIGFAYIVFAIVKRRPKGKNLVEITLMRTDKMIVLLQHDKFSGKVYVNINGEDKEIFQLPHFAFKLKVTFVPKLVNGIDRIDIVRPLYKAPLRGGWKYIVTCGNKCIEQVV